MTENAVCVVKNKKYKLVPPDGGWGYMIWIAAIINYTSTTMFVGSFGMIYDDFMKTLGMGSTSVSLLNGISVLCLAIAGFFTGPLLKAMGLRKLLFLAAFLFNLGYICTVFVYSQLLFFICQGLFTGVGFGILYNLSCTLINDYFVEKRLLSITFTQTVTAVFGMVGPQIVRWSLAEYGYRGTLLLISGIAMQTFVAVTIMQPVDAHMKRVPIEAEEGKGGEEMKLLMINNTDNNCKPLATPVITVTENNLFEDIKAVNRESDDLNARKCNFIKNIVKDIIDVPLLKKFLLSCASMGPTLAVIIESLFMILLPQALYAINWDENMVAQALSLTSMGDLVTRALLIFSSKWLAKIGNHEIYIISIAIAIVTKFGMLWTNNVTLMLIFITIMGVSRCVIMVLPPLILADTFNPEQFTQAMGTYMMCIGLFNLMLGTAIGAIRDVTDSYPTAFYIMTSCHAAILLLWSIEYFYKNSKHKRKLQAEASEKARKIKYLKKAKGK